MTMGWEKAEYLRLDKAHREAERAHEVSAESLSAANLALKAFLDEYWANHAIARVTKP